MDIDVKAEKSQLSAYVHMDRRETYDNEVFTMACVKRPLGGKWREYLELGCGLKFDYQVTGNIKVKVEVKSGNENIPDGKRFLSGSRFVLKPHNEIRKFFYEFNEKDAEHLADINEICFTVFYEDVNPEDPTGEFYISNCAIDRKEN